MKDIYLAGGCFRGVDAYFSNLDGVVATEVGYANGKQRQLAMRNCIKLTLQKL